MSRGVSVTSGGRMISIRIVSDGTPMNTHVFNHDGAEIKGITRIDMVLGVRDCLATAVLEFTAPELEMIAAWEHHPLKKWANKRTGKTPPS